MIYIVEDDASIRGLEEYALQNSGFHVKGFENGESCLAECNKQVPQLIVLDVMLPGEDGFSILKRLRASGPAKSVPVIMVTAKTSEIDVVTGLDCGADDYISKPFGVMEFISRVKAVLRRAEKKQDERMQYGPISLDEGTHTVQVSGKDISLTYKEYSLLKLLLCHAEKVLPRETIMKEVWDTEFFGESRTLDMHVRTLRQKLGDAGSMVHTVRKVGYCLSERDEAGE
ncbi:response regulator transcription factor [uncultured Ruthenibacterium sp.]|uniref:response regulator transcription factor n=1 Tax=uncultured Ruthenibacterium sp. TaxID=1905347 RepID=UPI00349EC318